MPLCVDNVAFCADKEDEKHPKYDFVYLPHPRSVVNFEWRRAAKRKRSIEDNVLLTTSRDNICRLWTPTSISAPYQFHMCAVIDPADFPLVESPELTGMHSIHWLPAEEVEKAIAAKERAEDLFLRKSDRRRSERKSKKLREAVKEYADMLFQILDDGAMIIWGVQNLTSLPRRVPKVLVVMKTDQTVPAADSPFLSENVIIYHRGYNVKQSSIFFPAELHILGRHPSTGVLNCYTMSLDDFFATSWTIPHLRLVHSWCGHRGPSRQVVRHPNLGWAASIAKDEEIVVYEVGTPQIGLRSTHGIMQAALFPPPTKQNAEPSARILAWLPQGPFLLIADSTLTLHQIDGNGSRELGQLSGYDASDPLIFLHVYYDPDANAGVSIPEHSDRSMMDAVVHVVGLSAKNNVFLWAVAKAGAHLFATCDDDADIVTFWHARNGKLAEITAAGVGSESVEEPWRPVAEFKVDEGKMLAVETDAFGKMAIGEGLVSGSEELERIRMINWGTFAVCEKGDVWTLSIWSNEATGLEMAKEWATTYSDPIVGLDWFFSSDGQHMLAVALIDRVQVLCQRRLAAVEDPVTWIVLTSMNMEMTDVVITSSWLVNASLIASTDRQAPVYDKWVNIADTLESNPLSVFTLADDTNGRLPDHHPQLLLQHLISGQFELVKYSLSLLYHYIKLLTEAGKLVGDAPVPLWKIFELGSDTETQAGQKYDALFEFDGEVAASKQSHVGDFDQEHAEYLSEQLTRISLPHISNIEQMRLVALIDTLLQVEKQKRSLDENGVRFVLFMRMFLFSQKAFPKVFKTESLTSRDIAWAFYSESQDILLDFANQAFNNKLMWKDARSLGMGFWLRNPETLRRMVETMARNQFMGKGEDDTTARDPVACSLFYIALKKKNVLLGLWKLAGSHPEQAAMVRFLTNDFENERWKAAALKNAFALLGKQRYEYAVAFFLIGDKLKDAVSVCLKQLNDIQLAIVICRVYEGEDGPVLKETLTNNVLPDTIAKGDRWLTSMIFTLLKQRDKALYATLMPLETLAPPSEDSPAATTSESSFSDPTLVLLYNHLRKAYRSMRMEQPVVPPDLECEFIYQSAGAYERLGCPGLALNIIKATPLTMKTVAAPKEEAKSEEGAATNGTVEVKQATDGAAGGIDWGAPVSASKPAETGGSIDWGAPASSTTAGGGGLDWGAPASSMTSGGGGGGGGIDWGAPVSSTTQSGGLDWGAPVSDKADSGGGGLDWSEMSSSQPATTSFDDEFEAFKKSLGGGTEDEPLADELDLDGDTAKESEPAESEAPNTNAIAGVDSKALLRYELEKRNVRLYKWMLAMRIVQAAYRSASNVSLNWEALKSDPTFHDYFSLLRDGFRNLCKNADMPEALMDEILPLRGELREYAGIVSSFVRDECSILARRAFSHHASEENLHHYEFISTLSRRLFWAIVRWQERVGEDAGEFSSTAAAQAAATAFLTLTVCSVRQRHFKALWWIVGLCDRFFDLLLKGKMTELREIIKDLLSERDPNAYPESESDAERTTDNDSGPDDDDWESNGDNTPPPPSSASRLAESLLLTICLQHVGLTFDSYLAQLRDGTNPAVDETYGFLHDAVLRRLSGMLFGMQKKVGSEWKKTSIRLEKIRKYLETPEQKALWSLIRRTLNVSKILEFTLRAAEVSDEEPRPVKGGERTEKTEADQNQGPEAASPESEEPREKEDAYETVWKTKEIIYTFAINPLDHNCMAVGTHKGIHEIDVNAALTYLQRPGNIAKRKISVDDMDVRGTVTKGDFAGGTANAHRLAEEIRGRKSPILKRKNSMARNLSFDSMQKAIAKSMQSLRRQESSEIELDDGERLVRNVPGVSSLEAHPSLNYYLAGISEGASTDATVQLYQFGQERELVSYSSGTTARITRCRFDPFGARFGASDSKGHLYLWRFDASTQSLMPSQSLKCHSSAAHDFTFLSSATLLATAGVSSSYNNVCLWDTLLPPAKSRVKAFSVLDGGAYSLVYAPRRQLLIAGGRKGDITVIDARQRTVINTFQADDHIVKTLAIDEETDRLVCGSSGGVVKVWDLDTFKE
ncbi:regulator of (H+)-ATPase in vacuolar membrane, partial [Borealophlyctis nickersoniae]